MILTPEVVGDAFDCFGSDKKDHHGYEDFYSEILSKDIHSLLEIGVYEGASLAAFRSLLPSAKIYGLDPRTRKFNSDLLKYADAEIVLADSTDSASADLIENVDLIIDDGDHYIESQIKTFENFKDRFNKYYVIEDVLGYAEPLVNKIKQHGFKDIKVFKSKFSTGTMKGLNNWYLKYHKKTLPWDWGVDEICYMYAVIIRK